MKRKLGHIDLNTGEVFGEGTLAYFPTKRQNGFVEGWLAMANLVFRTLKMFTHAHDLRVMMALLEEVDYENKIVICQADIARDLGMQRSNVSSAIKRLVEAGLILKDSKKGVTCFYRLSPEFGWKGSAKNHITAKREHLKGQRKAAQAANATEQKDANA